MYPINENFSYTTPNHEIYDSYNIHLGESYVEIEYDDNYQNDMMFYSYPIVKDNSLLFVITFVFDFNYIRDNIIKSIKNETMTLIYVQENNDMYKIENKKIEYVKKYGGMIEVFDSSKWTDSAKDKIYYQKYYDENEFYEKETIYSHYMNGLIYVSDNDRLSFMDMIDRLIYSLITVGGLFAAVNWYYRRKEKRGRRASKENRRT